MNQFQNALARMTLDRPATAKVQCEAHGEQPWERAPADLHPFLSARSPRHGSWTCKRCIKDSRTALAEAEHERRREKERALQAKRRAKKEAIKRAKAADYRIAGLLTRVKTGSQAEGDLKARARSLEERVESKKDAYEAALEKYEKARTAWLEASAAHEMAVTGAEDAGGDAARARAELREAVKDADDLWRAVPRMKRKQERNTTHVRAARKLLGLS